MPAMEPEPAASSVLEEKLEVPSDQVCEPAITSNPVGLIIKLKEEEWLIDLTKEIVLPTLPTFFTTSPFLHK